MRGQVDRRLEHAHAVAQLFAAGRVSLAAKMRCEKVSPRKVAEMASARFGVRIECHHVQYLERAPRHAPTHPAAKHLAAFYGIPWAEVLRAAGAA